MESEGHDYTNIKIDTEGLTVQEESDNKPYEANAQSNGAAVEMVRIICSLCHLGRKTQRDHFVCLSITLVLTTGDTIMCSLEYSCMLTNPPDSIMSLTI